MKQYVYILVLLITRVSLAAGQPFLERGETADEFLNRYAAWLETIPFADRAWDEMLAIDQQILEHFGGQGALTADPADDRWEQTVDFVRSNPELINRIKQYSSRAYLGVPREAMLDEQQDDAEHIFVLQDLLLPHLSPVRYQTILLTVDSMLAAKNGDVDGSIESLESIRKMQRFIPLTHVLIEGLVEVACSSMGSNMISDGLLNLSELNEEQLLRLRKIYVDEPLEMDEDATYAKEQWVVEDLLKSFYKGSKGGRITLRGTQRFLNAVNMVNGDAPSEDLDAIAADFQRKIAKFQSQKQVLDQYWTMFFNDISQEPSKIKSFESESFLNQYTAGDFEENIEFSPAVFFTPALRGPHNRVLYYQIYRNTYSLLIGLHLHRVHAGSIPESIDMLDEGHLGVPPTDLFSGHRLRFKVNGESVTIYSTGPDRDDDGGRPLMADGEIVKWPDFLTLDELNAISDPASIDGDWVLYPVVSE